jgi:flagella basal body P-ring formation protein FlgA
MFAAALAAQIAAFTGQPVTLDARLAPPDCATPPAIAWVPPGRGAVSVSCAAPGWRLFVPVVAAAAPRAVPVVRRGDIVAVVAAGAGFRISVAAVAESDAAPGGRVRLRNRATGERLQGDVREDGEIWLAGL